MVDIGVPRHKHKVQLRYASGLHVRFRYGKKFRHLAPPFKYSVVYHTGQLYTTRGRRYSRRPKKSSILSAHLNIGTHLLRLGCGRHAVEVIDCLIGSKVWRDRKLCTLEVGRFDDFAAQFG
ncbi:hypothetical protein SDC9_159216 [bioreactor metagenome]|uniref:Uncharacterized protein n=1 Tax=bioreactor metagenome TaxID=1076179 RepID=A0A645FCA1_9ZZZZ